MSQRIDYDYELYEDALLHKDPSIWRNGPAKLFYDMLGIPTEGHLNYGQVLDQARERLFSNDTDEDEALMIEENEDKSDEVQLLQSEEVEARNIPDMELESAVQSILVGETSTPTYLGNDSDSIPFERSPVKDIVYDQSTLALTPPRASDYNSNPWSLSCLSTKSGNTDELFKQRIAEAEVITAVDALLREMAKEPKPSHCDSDSELQGLNQNSLNPRDTGEEFNLVSQMEWEKDVVWTPRSILPELNTSTLKGKLDRVGWIPTLTTRKFAIQAETEGPDRNKDFKPLFSVENDNLIKGNWERDIIWDVDQFLDQNPRPKILYIDATDDQIVFQKPKDKEPLDPQQQQLQQRLNNSPTKASTLSPPKKVVQPHAIKSKLLLGKAGFIHWKWQMEQQELKAKELAVKREQERDNSSSIPPVKQPQEINYNLSNDEYYMGKDSMNGDMLKMCAMNFIRHSKVVLDMQAPFMTTYLSQEELKNFHRPQLKHHSNAPRPPNFHKIGSCYHTKNRKAKEWNKAIKDGHPILLDRSADLTGTDGELILVENSEEFPPLMSQVGMCSKVINYFRRMSLRDRYAHGVPHPYGETIFVYGSSSPFLGILEPGQVLSSLENNMYRSPIYKHSNPASDFILIVNKNGLYIREFDAIFTAGQQCPLIEVPEPNSVRTKTFMKNLLLAFVYRKFSKFSLGSTARIKLCELNRNFPGLYESTLKLWLKSCAEIKRIGSTTWVVMKNGFVLPDENELKEMVTPEQCCAYYSLLAAEQRLKDAGFHSLLSLPERQEGSAEQTQQDLVSSDPTPSSSKKTAGTTTEAPEQISQQNQCRLAEEVKAAPWNTTSAFVAATKGKCLLQVTGPADPTGCGEGFSYIRVAKKGPHGHGGLLEMRKQHLQLMQQRQKNKNQQGHTVGGTDADLRKLSSKNAKDILRKAGLPEKEVSKLSRWEVIDVVRTLSTEKAKLGESGDKSMQGLAKYSRWKNQTHLVMNLERYKEDCQRIFELQNKVLASNEILSTDEEEEDDDEENEVAMATQADITEMGQNLEKILRDGMTASELAHEEEELERLELQKLMLGGIQAKDAEIAKKADLLKKSKEQKDKQERDFLADFINHPGRKLKISRTFKENGHSFLRTEIVRDPVVIAAYLKIRTTKSEEFIKDFLQKADRQLRKEQKLKEKLLLSEIQEIRPAVNAKVQKIQLKRKNELETEYFPNKAAKVKAQREISKGGRKCGACGMLGHTRTSSLCPLNNPEKMEQHGIKLVIKKEKRGRGRPPRGRKETYSDIQVIKPPKLSKQMKEVMKKNVVAGTSASAQDKESSSSDSSDGEDASSDNSGSGSGYDSSGHSDPDAGGGSGVAPNEDQAMVKVDGLKMVLKVPQDMVVKAQIEEQREEEEAARILLSISSGMGCPKRVGTIKKRRTSQTEREHADYNDRTYKTTAADRIRKKI